jgi:hypothetical protein
MRHLRTFQKFTLNESIRLDLPDRHHEGRQLEHRLDLNKKILTVIYDSTDWYDLDKFEEWIEELAANDHWTGAEDIDKALYAHGYIQN